MWQKSSSSIRSEEETQLSIFILRAGILWCSKSKFLEFSKLFPFWISTNIYLLFEYIFQNYRTYFNLLFSLSMTFRGSFTLHCSCSESVSSGGEIWGQSQKQPESHQIVLWSAAVYWWRESAEITFCLLGLKVDLSSLLFNNLTAAVISIVL